MPLRHQFLLIRLLTCTACLLIGKVLVEILLNYRYYLPPDFERGEFLIGRDGYFWQGYHWAFYPHILVGPFTLVAGTLLVSEPFRRRYPRWHRMIGRCQVVCVSFVVVPSGLWMARYAASGPVAAVGFVLLSLLTGITIVLGWWGAVRRRFVSHRRWMWRCYLLLCSTVILRLMGGFGRVMEIDGNWYYAQMAWTSWLVPLVVFELQERIRGGVPAVLAPRA